MRVFIFFIFQTCFLNVIAQVDSTGFEIGKNRFKYEYVMPTIQQLFDDQRLDSIQYFMQLNNSAFELKMDQFKNYEKNLNESRLKKDGESLEFMEEKTFDNSTDARKYVLDNLHSNTIVVADKLSLNSFKIRVFKVIYKEKEEM